MTTYIVKTYRSEGKFLDFISAVKEAETLGEEGTDAFVYKEIDGVREDEPIFSCVWEI